MTGEVGRAIWTSVAVAVVVQSAGLLVLRFSGPRLLIGWVAGAVLRLVAVLVYAWAIVPALRLALVPALLSLVALLFVTTLVESIMLQRIAH